MYLKLLRIVMPSLWRIMTRAVLIKVLISEIMEEAQRLKIPVAVDPKKRNFSHFKGASLFKPNLKELNEGLKVDIGPTQQSAIHEGHCSFRQAARLSKLFSNPIRAWRFCEQRQAIYWSSSSCEIDC